MSNNFYHKTLCTGHVHYEQDTIYSHYVLILCTDTMYITLCSVQDTMYRTLYVQTLCTDNMYRTVCTGRYVQDTMYRHYVQDMMYRRLCTGHYVQTPCTDNMYRHYVQDTMYRHFVQTICTDTMYRTLCTGHYVQDTMYRTPLNFNGLNYIYWCIVCRCILF